LAVVQCRREFGHWLRSNFALDDVKRSDVLLAANEALTNSAEFAYVASAEHGPIAMRATFEEIDRRLSIEITDFGTWRETPPSTQPNTRGRGIPLMQALADRVTIARQATGTRVRLEFDDVTFLGEDSEDTYATTA
jgi:anti-sigma regulatory factor (Ser/Thr protein kinase)